MKKGLADDLSGPPHEFERSFILWSVQTGAQGFNSEIMQSFKRMPSVLTLQN